MVAFVALVAVVAVVAVDALPLRLALMVPAEKWPPPVPTGECMGRRCRRAGREAVGQDPLGSSGILFPAAVGAGVVPSPCLCRPPLPAVASRR